MAVVGNAAAGGRTRDSSSTAANRRPQQRPKRAGAPKVTPHVASPSHDTQVATMLLYRCLLGDAVSPDTLRLVLRAHANVRGTQGGIHGLAFRQYCYRFLLDAEARESLKTQFSPRGAANRAASGTHLVHCATFWLGAGVGRCTWLSRQAIANGQLQVACTPLLEPLHIAASMGHDDACAILLEAGALVDAPAYYDRTLAGISRTECPEVPITPLVLAARRDDPNTALLLLQRMTGQGGASDAALQALPYLLRMRSLAPRLFDACLRLGLPREAQRQWLAPNACASAAGWSLTVPQVLVYEGGGPASNRQLLLFLAAATTDPVLLEALLSHVLPKPPSDAALGLAMLNFALAHNDAPLLDALLARGLRADGRDMVDVPIVHAAVRGGCTALVVRTLLQHGADPNLDTPPVDGAESGALGPLQAAWEARCWMAARPAVDVALAELGRALREDATAVACAFAVDWRGVATPAALHALTLLETLQDAGALACHERVADVVNAALSRLQARFHEAKRGGDAGVGVQPPDAQLPGRVSQLVGWLRRTRKPSDGGAQVGGTAAAEERLTVAGSMDARAEEAWFHGAARFLRLLLLTGERLPWTPALHQLFPRPFKQTVRTLLLCARGGHSGSGNNDGDPQPSAAAAAAAAAAVAANGVAGSTTSEEATSHYSDADSAVPGEFSTPGSIKGERPVLDEDEAPMFTPFDVRLQAHLGEESSQEEVSSPGVSAASEATSTGGKVALPLPVVLKIAGYMAFPLSAWLASEAE